MDKEERIDMICRAVAGIEYAEWTRIRVAIDKKYSSKSSHVTVDDPEEFKRMIKVELL